MLKLSVVIITLNEEKNIARCLESIKEIADEIIIIDSFSTDKTEEICKTYDVKFIKHKWEGYSATKNFGNALASNKYILSLDADEALSPELVQSINGIKNNTNQIVYSFNRLTNYCGKWIKHCGWYPDKKIRIFDKNINRWIGEVHETLYIEPTQNIKHLKGDCLHYSYYSIEQHYQQATKYAELAAQELYAKGKKSSLFKLIINPIAKFIKCYVTNRGFLDGYYGFLICKISAYTTYLKYSKLRKLQNR